MIEIGLGVVMFFIGVYLFIVGVTFVLCLFGVMWMILISPFILLSTLWGKNEKV
jgi:hypothetical protein